MTGESKIWAHDSLEIDEKGYVVGSAYTHTFAGKYTVSVGVSSYKLGERYKDDMNYVPNVVVSDEDGVVVAEPHSNDSSSGKKAIENAKGTAEYVFNNPEQFDLD